MLAKDDKITFWPSYDVTLNPELTEATMTVTVEIEYHYYDPTYW